MYDCPTLGYIHSQEVYENGLRGLVELTSVSIELFRKMAEISLLPQVHVHVSSHIKTCMYLVELDLHLQRSDMYSSAGSESES